MRVYKCLLEGVMGPRLPIRSRTGRSNRRKESRSKSETEETRPREGKKGQSLVSNVLLRILPSQPLKTSTEPPLDKDLYLIFRNFF